MPSAKTESAFNQAAPAFLDLLVSSVQNASTLLGHTAFSSSQVASSQSRRDASRSPETFLQSVPGPERYVDVDGPISEEETLIRYDTPFAPSDPKRSLLLRTKLGLTAEERAVDPNVRVILDSFIHPRRWRDPATGVTWVQHACPYLTSRTETIETRARLRQKLQEFHVKRTGTCPIRTVLIAECFLEVIRQVVAECWERGLLLLHVHAERVAAQAAHRELFESRVGHAFRLALKGDKDTTAVQAEIGDLKVRIATLEAEERELRTKCADFSLYAEEQLLIEEKQHNDTMTSLRREGLLKRNQLEQMLAVPLPH